MSGDDKRVTFTELVKLAQKEPRKPCGKQGFSMEVAIGAANARNAFTSKSWYVTVCYEGCGRNIFHLTTRKPKSKKQKKFNRKVKQKRIGEGNVGLLP